MHLLRCLHKEGNIMLYILFSHTTHWSRKTLNSCLLFLFYFSNLSPLIFESFQLVFMGSSHALNHRFRLKEPWTHVLQTHQLKQGQPILLQLPVEDLMGDCDESLTDVKIIYRSSLIYQGSHFVPESGQLSVVSPWWVYDDCSQSPSCPSYLWKWFPGGSSPLTLPGINWPVLGRILFLGGRADKTFQRQLRVALQWHLPALSTRGCSPSGPMDLQTSKLF